MVRVRYVTWLFFCYLAILCPDHLYIALSTLLHNFDFAMNIGIFHTHLQILMNVRQHKLGTANTDVEIHWGRINATVMKGIHCKAMNAKVSLHTYNIIRIYPTDSLMNLFFMHQILFSAFF